MAKAFKPQIVTGNDLLEGDVIYLTAADGWSRRHRDAAVAAEPDEAEALLARAKRQPARVVEPYLADAAIDADGAPSPVHYRERLRTLGPSNRPDLGRQADAAAR